MARYQIPFTPDAPHQRFGVQLDTVNYQLELVWNTRAEAWYLTVYTADLDVILAGRKVVPGVPLWGRSRDARLPPGQLVVVDTTGAGSTPRRTELGETYLLVYLDAEELASA